jgi:hypothetical protein
MRYKALLFAAFMFLVAVAVSSQTSRAQAAGEPTVKADEQPTSYFRKADEFFLKKDWKRAASEIRKGARFLRQKTKSATKESKEGLGTSAQELEKLAKDVKSGTVTSEKQLKDAFARSYEALSRHEYGKASESWTRKKTKETGQALTNAVRDMEEAAKWAGRELERTTADAVSYAHAVGGKLVKGADWTADEVEKGINGIRGALSNLGKTTDAKDR